MTSRSYSAGSANRQSKGNCKLPTYEVNFDGIVGPTHSYAGLSYGNLASAAHEHQASNPQAAALQGLDKMRFVHELGVRQAVLPPSRRPRLDVLRRLGFAGSDAEVIEAAGRTDPALLAAVYSASNMWTANAATVSPSADCADDRLHLTPANLVNSLHRAIEAEETSQVLRVIFDDEQHFMVHEPLPPGLTLSDEGAANHSRLCREFGEPGCELFVYGRDALDASQPRPQQFPARQTRQASAAIARRHGLNDKMAMFVQQNPQVIDQGVFHNDVISVANQNVFLFHEQAFVETSSRVQELARQYEETCHDRLILIRLSTDDLSIQDAVSSYLFNSQLLTRPGGGMTMVCPQECAENAAARRCTEQLLAGDNPIDQVEFLPLRQSMNNGGGPACLRLRVVLTEPELAATHGGVIFTPQLHDDLTAWVRRHYRDRLVEDDLRDPQLAMEIAAAFEQLSSILNLPPRLFGL